LIRRRITFSITYENREQFIYMLKGQPMDIATKAGRYGAAPRRGGSGRLAQQGCSVGETSPFSLFKTKHIY